jgi:molybdate transport system permease protein
MDRAGDGRAGAAGARRPRLRRSPFELTAAAAALLACAFLGLPLAALFVRGDLAAGLTSERTAEAIRLSLLTSTISLALIVVVGTPAAWLLVSRRFRGHALVATLLELPLVLPPAVAGIGLLAAFGVGGLLGPTLSDAGVVLPFSEWAVVFAVTFVASPFYMRQAIAAFEGVDPSLVSAARTLGAGPVRTLLRISLPLAASGLVAGWVLAFARGIGEFGATIVFAGSVRGETQTLTLGIYEQLDSEFDQALAIGILLVVLSATVLVSYKLISTWRSSSSTSPSPFARTSSPSR